MKIIIFIIIGFLVFLSILVSVYIDVFSIQKLSDREADIDSIKFRSVVFPRKER